MTCTSIVFGGPVGQPFEFILETIDGVQQVQKSVNEPVFIGDFIEGGHFVVFRNVFGDAFNLSGMGSMNAIEIDSASYDCLAGDFNSDGVIDAEDIDALTQQIKDGGFDPCFDLNNDGVIDQDDCMVWVDDLKETCLGDANLDGEFNSADLVFVFQSGEYEDDIECNSGWAEGDWNCDGEFDSSDFVVAFQQGWYENGPLRALANEDFDAVGSVELTEFESRVAAVPEPSSNVLFIVGALVCWRRRRHG